MGNQKVHNPDYKLVSKRVVQDGKYLDLVYGVSNSNENEGLEVYYYNDDDISKGHYTSRRWLSHEIPKVHADVYAELKGYVGEVKEGHLLEV